VTTKVLTHTKIPVLVCHWRGHDCECHATGDLRWTSGI